MNTEPAIDVRALLAQVMADPGTLVERVLTHVLEQLAGEMEFARGGDEPPEELLAAVLGNRLARTILDGGEPAVEAPGHEELVTRNSVLAAALGACDCWGEEGDCPVCGGAGAPGWALPDERLFARHIHPAVRAATRHSAGDEPKETNDVRHVAR